MAIEKTLWVHPFSLLTWRRFSPSLDPRQGYNALADPLTRPEIHHSIFLNPPFLPSPLLFFFPIEESSFNGETLPHLFLRTSIFLKKK